MESLIDKIKNDLNERQLEAVTTVDGPLLVLAGAGSGKTRVLTYRAAYITAGRGVSPFNILAVTFTNKAAGEMRSRMESLVGPAVRDMQVSTFHSFCVRILRRFGDRAGIPRGFTIYDEDDALSLIKRCMLSLGISTKSHSPRAVRELISSAKDKLVGPVEYETTAKAHFNKVVASVYTMYQECLRSADAVDFDDLLFKTVVLLNANPDVLESLQNKYRYIMVDEYQDTNHAQYMLVKYLAARDRNVCVVGDDDQSIYGWRGADIRNILDFEKDFPGCKVVKLEQNYRSTKTILKAAHGVVKNNYSRKDKVLFSEGVEGEKIRLLVTNDDRDEAETIVDRIETLISTSAARRSEIAILYRTNAQSRAIEEVLKNRFIPYTVVGGLRFYQRKEIKDTLAYLRVLVNPKDIASFRRVVNYPVRGIGKVALANIENLAAGHGLSPVELILSTDDYSFLKGKAKSGIIDFVSIVRDLLAMKESQTPAELIRSVISRSGIMRDIEAGDRIEADTRKENLDELVAGVEEFCQMNVDATIEMFLEEISLYTDIDHWDESVDSVTLMTLHAAKGLEFSAVFITGLEEGLFPIARASGHEKEIEEERRLFYVGITRAEKYLFISYARSRRRFQGSLSLESRFLREIPSEVIEIEQTTSRAQYVMPRPSKSARFDFDDEIQASGDDIYSSLQVGRWVLHPTWGEGQIINRRGMSESTEIDVLFRLCGRKKLIAKYARLQLLG